MYFPRQDACRSVLESMLAATGEFDSIDDYLGRGFEISYDPVMEADMSFVDGCYRCPASSGKYSFLQKGRD